MMSDSQSLTGHELVKYVLENTEKYLREGREMTERNVEEAIRGRTKQIRERHALARVCGTYTYTMERAARLMRSRANRAIRSEGGTWHAEGNLDYVTYVDMMHPDIALANADLLDDEVIRIAAAITEGTDPRPHEALLRIAERVTGTVYPSIEREHDPNPKRTKEDFKSLDRYYVLNSNCIAGYKCRWPDECPHLNEI